MGKSAGFVILLKWCMFCFTSAFGLAETVSRGFGLVVRDRGWASILGRDRWMREGFLVSF